MKRHWTSFDKNVTNKEFLSLPIEDRVGLFEAMKLFRLDAGIGYVIKNYGQGLLMIKPKEGQGRCLFFCVVESAETQELVALLAYKKETPRLPERLRKLAIDRMRTYKDRTQ